ncbi:hypothetical protein [Streptomyces eurythermus]
MSSPVGVVHLCPPPGGVFTSCCLRKTTELPAADWYTTDPLRVTCTTRQTAEPAADSDGGESPFGCRELP